MTRPGLPLRNERAKHLQDLRDEVRGLLESWYDGFTLARPRWLERYLRKELVCHVHGFHGSTNFCARVEREELSELDIVSVIDHREHLGSEIDDGQDLMFVEPIQFMDEPQRVISRSGLIHQIRLQRLDYCTSVLGEALYLSLPRFSYVFREFPPHWEACAFSNRAPIGPHEATDHHV